MSKKDPVHYAEDDLGVHNIYDEARAHFDDHSYYTKQVESLNLQIRDIKTQIEDREREVVSDERAKQLDLSKTAFGEHLKEVLKADESLRAMRGDLSALEAERSNCELNLKNLSLGIQLRSARMEELGGLLYFYAVCKGVAASGPGEDFGPR